MKNMKSERTGLIFYDILNASEIFLNLKPKKGGWMTIKSLEIPFLLYIEYILFAHEIN